VRRAVLLNLNLPAFLINRKAVSGKRAVELSDKELSSNKDQINSKQLEAL